MKLSRKTLLSMFDPPRISWPLARSFADLNRALFLEQQRTAALTERLALVESDLEAIHIELAKITQGRAFLSRPLAMTSGKTAF